MRGGSIGIEDMNTASVGYGVAWVGAVRGYTVEGRDGERRSRRSCKMAGCGGDRTRRKLKREVGQSERGCGSIVVFERAKRSARQGVGRADEIE